MLFLLALTALVSAASTNGALFCANGQKPSNAQSTDVRANSEAACQTECNKRPNCLAFDYTTKNKEDSCRLVDVRGTRRTDRGDDRRIYCVVYTKPAANSCYKVFVGKSSSAKKKLDFTALPPKNFKCPTVVNAKGYTFTTKLETPFTRTEGMATVVTRTDKVEGWNFEFTFDCCPYVPGPSGSDPSGSGPTYEDCDAGTAAKCSGDALAKGACLDEVLTGKIEKNCDCWQTKLDCQTVNKCDGKPAAEKAKEAGCTVTSGAVGLTMSSVVAIVALPLLF